MFNLLSSLEERLYQIALGFIVITGSFNIFKISARSPP